MDYKILSNEMYHTGGGCWTLLSTVFLVKDKRTVYMYTYDEGQAMMAGDTMYHYDALQECFPNEEVDIELQLDERSYDTYDTCHPYHDLFNDCLAEYCAETADKFECVETLPYDLINWKLREQISADYYEWHKANVGDKFEIYGRTVIIDPKFIETLNGQ